MSYSAYQQRAQAAADPLELEFRAFSEVTSRLMRANEEGAPAKQRISALADNILLWSILTSDLATPGNAYPKELRAKLISLGIWAQKTSRAAMRTAGSLSPLIEVNRNIAEGLAQAARNSQATQSNESEAHEASNSKVAQAV